MWGLRSVIVLQLCLCVCASSATVYSDDLSDIMAADPILGHLGIGRHEPTPIGNLGMIETVIDLRGFVPMAFTSKRNVRSSLSLSSVVKSSPSLGWYKIPTRTALRLLYYGDLKSTQIAEDAPDQSGDFKSTHFLDEANLTRDQALWCKLAYTTARNSDALFRRLAGNYKSSEPILVVFTKRSTFIFISLGYTSMLTSNGQVLVSLEFSRSLKEYKTLYPVYTTMLISESAEQAFLDSAPYVAKLISAVFIGQ